MTDKQLTGGLPADRIAYILYTRLEINILYEDTYSIIYPDIKFLKKSCDVVSLRCRSRTLGASESEASRPL